MTYPRLLLFIVLTGMVFFIEAASGEIQINDARAKYHYQMFCQGCHTPDGQGGKGVPQLKDFVGHFLKSQQGREFLVRVPGSANSPLSNEQLAEVLNWVLIEFANISLSGKWTPYTAQEIAGYRNQPLFEIIQYRHQLLSEIGQTELLIQP